MVTRTVSTADIQEIVKRHAAKYQEPDRRLHVVDGAVMHVSEGVPETDDRWYVRVKCDPETMDHLVWYGDVTGRIEDEIKAEEGLNIYLQSVLPHY